MLANFVPIADLKKGLLSHVSAYPWHDICKPRCAYIAYLGLWSKLWKQDAKALPCNYLLYFIARKSPYQSIPPLLVISRKGIHDFNPSCSFRSYRAVLLLFPAWLDWLVDHDLLLNTRDLALMSTERQSFSASQRLWLSLTGLWDHTTGTRKRAPPWLNELRSIFPVCGWVRQEKRRNQTTWR